MYTNAKVEELRTNLTSQIIASIENGNPLWRKRWAMGPNAGAPAAGSTRKSYRGGNAMILSMLTSTDGYSSKWWNTFNNWAKIGVFPKQGSKGTWCQYLETRRVKDRNDESKERNLFIYKAFVLFNAEQCHDARDAGVLDKYLCHENQDISAVSYECVHALLAKHSITLRHGGSQAYYAPLPDYVQMPKKGFFASAEDYYATLCHEVTHWAQHHYGGRKLMGSDAEYADGELSAELGSIFLMKELGIPYGNAAQYEGSAGYLKGWLKRLNEDSKYIFKAASDAGKLVDFLVGNNAEVEEEEMAAV